MTQWAASDNICREEILNFFLNAAAKKSLADFLPPNQLRNAGNFVFQVVRHKKNCKFLVAKFF